MDWRSWHQDGNVPLQDVRHSRHFSTVLCVLYPRSITCQRSAYQCPLIETQYNNWLTELLEFSFQK
ncbi:hypothetical protein RvY_03197 [Ramazzottius varieornatus]|uniref:Uncharacterized protein n=1 Tax=Ramazzottius varieornatus TaxID=947166 RepID=A0A1D1UM98_RAMVA|nr:hypothetical protein RvY_03197 [Ramazzottius varieornatus]